MSKNTLPVEVVSPVPRDLWEQEFKADQMAVPYQSPRWFEGLCVGGNYKDASRWYHLGETGDSKSLAYYKMRFGAAPIEYADYVIEKLPISRIDRCARGLIKRAIGFRDTNNEDG